MERAEIKHERVEMVEMAEIMVSTLLTNISQLIANEGNLLRGVEDQVRSLQNQLQYMRIFLKDFERVDDQDVIQLVDEIRKVAGEAEDIIDMHVVNVAKQKSRRKVLKLFSSPRQANVLSDVLDKITELEKRITAIYEDVDKYIQTQTSVNEHKNDDDDYESKKIEVVMVGFVDEEKTLVDQLINGTEELDVISILGMGGLGKTTLARKVYGNPSVRSHFGCRAWVSVSQKFKLKELLLAILVEPASEMTEAGLRKKIPTMIESEAKEETSKVTEAELRGKMSEMTEAQMKDVMSKMTEAEQRKKMSKKIKEELKEATSNTTTKTEKMSMKTEAEELRKEISMMTEAELKSKMSTMTDAEVKEAMSKMTEAELRKQMSTMTEPELRKKIIEVERKKLSMDRELELRKKVIKKLQTKRYLIVLDDVWSTEVWNELKRFLPRNQNGSRVFLTTRIEQVACQAMNNPPLRLRFLNEIESWKLLAQEVSRGDDSSNPTSEPLQRKVWDKTGGLPLALVWLGNLLKEKASNEWEAIIEDFDRQIEQETRCLDNLGLSYGDLPPYLRPCFLYLGLFPQGYKIRANKLIQLWISEGFIENNRLRKEVVAESYLHELIKRNLVHVQETGSHGGVKTCHLHVLVRVLCNRLSRDMEFYYESHHIRSSQTPPRRVSVHDFGPRDYILKASASNTSLVRTLLCFSQKELKFSGEHWEKLLRGFKLLKILDLGKAEVERIPQDVEKLILLKYLRIKTTSVPPSIWALHNLQTLDLRGSQSSQSSQVRELPEEFWGMEQLRHLYLDGNNSLPQNQGGKCLYNLQTLFYISKNPTAPVHIAESTPKLRKLGLKGYSCESLDELMSPFNLHYLESLKFLNGCTFKKAIKLPKSITSISIKEAGRIDTETIRMFQCLTKLRILKFAGASFDDDQLVFEQGCFPELQFLKIESKSIKAWKLVQGAVPKLRRVVISKCPELIELPERLIDMPTLQELEVPESANINEAVKQIKSSQRKVVINHAPA